MPFIKMLATQFSYPGIFISHDLNKPTTLERHIKCSYLVFTSSFCYKLESKIRLQWTSSNSKPFDQQKKPTWCVTLNQMYSSVWMTVDNMTTIMNKLCPITSPTDQMKKPYIIAWFVVARRGWCSDPITSFVFIMCRVHFSIFFVTFGQFSIDQS